MPKFSGNESPHQVLIFLFSFLHHGNLAKCYHKHLKNLLKSKKVNGFRQIPMEIIYKKTL